MGQAGDLCPPTGLCDLHFWPAGGEGVCAGNDGMMQNKKDNGIFEDILWYFSYDFRSGFKTGLITDSEKEPVSV